MKRIIIGILCLIGIAIIALIIFLRIVMPPPISQRNMERQFTENKDVLFRVARYLEPYSSAVIRPTYEKGVMFAERHAQEERSYVTITDTSIAEDIVELFKKHGFEVIIRRENAIYFQRWSNLKRGRGVVYSIDGDLPQYERFIILEPLKEEKWFFYEKK